MAFPLMMATGLGLQTGANIYSSLQARKDLKKQALALEDQARLVEEQGEYEAIQTAKQFDNLLGEQKFATAISGSEEEGSVLDIFNKTLRDKETSVKFIREATRRQAEQLRNQAKQTKKARKKVLVGALLGSAGSIGSAYSSNQNLQNKTYTTN